MATVDTATAATKAALIAAFEAQARVDRFPNDDGSFVGLDDFDVD